jgi:hypothetical protein
LSKRATDSGHAIDVFVGCYDQVGLLEMKTCFSKTGGFVVLSDSFNTTIFKQSFQRLFTKKDGNLMMSFNANLDIQTSKELKICGAIGPCVSNNKKTPHVGETVCLCLCPLLFLSTIFSPRNYLGNWNWRNQLLEVLWHSPNHNHSRLL